MTDSLPTRLVQLANAWMEAAGAHLLFLRCLRSADLVTGEDSPAKRALMAAARDLVELLAQTPEGRQALRDFGLEPVLEQVEGE